VRPTAAKDTTKRQPTSPRKDATQDCPRRIRDSKFLTKAELIEQHAELKKTLQLLKTQRDSAQEEEENLRREIQSLQRFGDDRSDDSTG
jgi:putative IMPACT (imprinted ancient) family translation regulator